MKSGRLDIDLVDLESVKIDGIDYKDYPDFCDAFIASAKYNNGEPLSSDDCDAFMNEHTTVFYELVWEKAHHEC